MDTQTAPPPQKVLDHTLPQKVSYCIPLWLRDEQIRINIGQVPGRIAPRAVTDDPVAVVCYGPSLADTWQELQPFSAIVSCSGAHKFLVERGIIPAYHVEVDPRLHKIELMGEPHPDVEYLIASTCHPAYLKRLVDGGFNVKLWHVFDGADEAIRVLPPGEWALTGGCSVGLRAMAIARFLGFRRQHVFGMDGCSGKTGKHAAAHPNQAPGSAITVYKGVTYETTQGFLEAARTTWHELDDLVDVDATFHGEGLVQAMAKDYVRTPRPKLHAGSSLAFSKPLLITESYRQQNAQLHRDNLAYGVGAGKHAEVVKKLLPTMKTTDGLPLSVLDYGCGKGYLQKALPFPIAEYDPAIPGKEDSPRPADLVCCLDVLEHIEPDHLIFVLDDLRRCVKQLGYFVINTKAAAKTLPDGRNTHLIQEGEAWWRKILGDFFTAAKVWPMGPELHVLVSPGGKALTKPFAAPKQVVQAMLRLGGTAWREEPYLVGAAMNAVPEPLYGTLVETFPDVALAKDMGHKWSLSERNHPDAYIAFINRTPAWRAFHEYIKAPAFVAKIRTVLASRGVTLPDKGLTSRFEFSWLPADGGELRPHTDIPSKLVTLVLSMRPLGDDVWQAAWGGGTDVLKPKWDWMSVVGGDKLEDYKAHRDAFDVVETFAYTPNQCVIFAKTADSWHSVGPLAGPAGHWRKTVTINIEQA